MLLTTRNIVLGGLAFLALGNVGGLQRALSEGAQRADSRSLAASSRRAIRDRATEAQKDSRVALDIVKAGCVEIVFLENGSPTPMAIGERPIYAQTGQEIPQGTRVCNALGQAGEIGLDGIQYVVQAAPGKDSEIFKQYFDAIKTGDHRSINEES